MRRSIGAVALALALSGHATGHGQQLIARAPTGVTPEAERLLAANAEPWRLRLREGEGLESTARNLCGRLTPTYAALLRDTNRTRAADGMVTIPACFVFRKDAEVMVGPGESLAQLAWRSAGAAGPKTMKGILAANAFALPADVDVSTPLEAQGASVEAVTVPNATEAVSYDVKAGVDPIEIAKKLARALDLPHGAVDGPDTADELKLESSVVPGSGRAVPCSSANAAKYGSWPFALGHLTGALARIDAVLAARGSDPMPPAKVAVVDNGMDRIFEAEFPKEDFIINQAELNGRLGADDDNGFRDDIVGTNVYLQGQPVAFPESADPFHGTYMASLALGGNAYRTWQKTNFPARRVRIMAVSLVQRVSVAAEGGPRVSYAMPREGLRTALDYVLARKVNTVNLSISTGERLRMVEEAIFNHDDLLLIVAAGNDAYELNAKARNPASQARVEREYGGRVVAVAAHDQKGCLPSFSGRGDKVVDLAAPGVAIEGIGLGGQPIIDEGTSQATALTSFVAAMIRAASDMPPARVKDRLHAAVDLSPDLAPYVRSGGALNVGKALSLFDDVLELDGAARAASGRLEGDRHPETFCPGLSGDERTVLKLSRRVDSGNPSEIRLLLRDDDNMGVLEQVHCAPSGGDFSFLLLDGRKVAFKLSEVIDLVPAM